MFKIPADMNRADEAAAIGAEAIVSIRDLLLLLGATDEELRDLDERQEILEREPWRRKWKPLGKCGEYEVGIRSVDWSGTRFDRV